jgi:hypothetical protein
MSGCEFIETGGAPIKAWARGVPVEATARQQIKNVARLPFLHDHVAMIRDVHGACEGAVFGGATLTFLSLARRAPVASSSSGRFFGDLRRAGRDGGGQITSYGTIWDNDTVTHSTDRIIEAAGGGTDTVQSSVTYTLGANLENPTLTGTAAINGTGNGLNNVIMGNAAANQLNGGAGTDTLAAFENLTGSNLADHLTPIASPASTVGTP